VSYSNINNPAKYQLQSFGQDGMRTISTTQAYVEGEHYRVLVATEDSTLSATSMVGDDLASIEVYAGTTIYGLFTAVTVTAGEVTAYLAGRTDIDDVWAYIRAYGEANGATIEGEDCAKAAISPLLDKYYAQASLVMVPSLYKTSIVYSERPLSTYGQLTFSRASSATRVGPDGLIEKVRTNIVLYSEQFDLNAAWAKTGCTVTANSSTDPIGGTTADKMVSISGNTASKRVEQTFSAVSGTTYTVSAYFKADGWNFAFFNAPEAQFTTREDLFLNLTNGTLSGSTSLGSVESVGNGWYRLRYTRIATASGSTSFRFGFSDTASIASTGDGTNGVLIWGAQLETGDIATDYIPTTTVAVSVGPVANLPRLNYPINSDGSVGCPSLLLEPQRTNLGTYSESFDNATWVKDFSSVTANTTTSPDGTTNADTYTGNGGSNVKFIYQANSVTSGTTYSISVYAKKNTNNFLQINTATTPFGVNAWANFNLDSGVVGTVGSSATASMAHN
jgi:hypothetical protein